MYVHRYGRDEMLMFVLNPLRHNVVATTTLIIFLKQSAAKKKNSNKWVTIVYNTR